jgi:hypothetical protein
MKKGPPSEESSPRVWNRRELPGDELIHMVVMDKHFRLLTVGMLKPFISASSDDAAAFAIRHAAEKAIHALHLPVTQWHIPVFQSDDGDCGVERRFKFNFHNILLGDERLKAVPRKTLGQPT